MDGSPQGDMPEWTREDPAMRFFRSSARNHAGEQVAIAAATGPLHRDRRTAPPATELDALNAKRRRLGGPPLRLAQRRPSDSR